MGNGGPASRREGMVAAVPQVVAHLLVVRDVCASVDLRKAGHSGLDLVALVELRGPGGDDLWHVRPRADQAHVALHDVEELWQLIDGRLAERPADCGGVARPG